MRDKKQFTIIAIVLVIIAIIIGVSIANITLENETKQENKINEHIQNLLSKDIAYNDFSDYSITTSGKYQIVEKTICQFFDEYSKAFKDDKFENSNFENSKKLLQKDSIMDRIEKTGISSEYIELYRNYFYGDTDLANWLENQIKDSE